MRRGPVPRPPDSCLTAVLDQREGSGRRTERSQTCTLYRQNVRRSCRLWKAAGVPPSFPGVPPALLPLADSRTPESVLRTLLSPPDPSPPPPPALSAGSSAQTLTGLPHVTPPVLKAGPAPAPRGHRWAGTEGPSPGATGLAQFWAGAGWGGRLCRHQESCPSSPTPAHQQRPRRLHPALSQAALNAHASLAGDSWPVSRRAWALWGPIPHKVRRRETALLRASRLPPGGPSGSCGRTQQPPRGLPGQFR